jgi:hypothetical protein
MNGLVLKINPYSFRNTRGIDSNMALNPITKILVSVGVLLIVAGLAWQFGWIQSLRLGRLPGDIVIERENFKFYFPITTAILISVVLSLISRMWRQ